MSKFVPLALLATVATLAVVPQVVFAAETNQQVRTGAEAVSAAPSAAVAGKMLYGPDGHRIASVYRVRPNGDAELILDGRLVTVPANTLSIANGKLATSLTKHEINHR
jgi:hypothetical protein